MPFDRDDLPQTSERALGFSAPVAGSATADPDLGGWGDHEAPARDRALRWDGSCLYRIPLIQGWQDVTPDDVARLRADAERRPDMGARFVIAVGGRERSEDLATEARHVAALEAAGADWWHEYVPTRLTLQEARRRIESGPVRARSGPAATIGG